MTDLGKSLEKELTKKSNFPKRVKFARLRNKESRGSLAKNVGVSEAAIWQWENGGSVPQKANMLALAKALQVNVAWLKDGLGEMALVKEAKATIAEKTGLKKEDLVEEAPDGMNVIERLRWRKDKSNLSQRKLAKLTGLSPSTLGNHFIDPKSKHFRMPSEDALKRYAKALQVNLDWLMHGTGRVQSDIEPDKLDTFRDRVLFFLRERDWTIKQLAEKAAVHEQTMRSYLTRSPSRRYPSDEMYGTIARLLKIDVNWLRYGEGGKPKPEPEEKPDHSGFLTRLRQLLQASGKFDSVIGPELGKSKSFIYNIFKNEALPHPHNLKDLADYFKVSIGWLLTGEGEGPDYDLKPVEPEKKLAPPDDFDGKAFAKRLRELAAGLGKTYYEISAAAGYGSNWFSTVLHAVDKKNSLPMDKTIHSLANVFGVSPEYLLTGDKIAEVVDRHMPPMPISPEQDAEIQKMIDEAEEEAPGESLPVGRPTEGEHIPVRIATVSAESLGMISQQVAAAKDKRDRLLAEADLAQRDLDKWTEILMKELSQAA